MRATFALIACVAIAVTIHAAPLIDEPVAELRLKSGKVYRDAVARNYSPTAVFVKHSDGGVSVKYEDLPDDLAVAANARRPAAPPPKAAPPPPPSRPLLTAATGSPASLSGQVFVTTKGSDNIKLGGVTISVYSSEDFNKQHAWKRAAIDPEIKKHLTNSERAQKFDDYDTAIAEINLYQRKKHASWQHIEQAEFSTVTDADGRFTLNHRVPKPFTVFATASRNLGEKTEYYVWMIESDQIAEPSNLLLQNNNML